MDRRNPQSPRRSHEKTVSLCAMSMALRAGRQRWHCSPRSISFSGVPTHRSIVAKVSVPEARMISLDSAGKDGAS